MTHFQEIQSQYEKLAADLESTSYVSTSAYSSNWFREFKRIAEDQLMNITTEEQFMSELREVCILNTAECHKN